MVFIVTTILFAGGSGQSAGSSGGPAKLTVAMSEDVRIKDFKTNHQTLLIEKRANVDLEFVMLPRTDYNNKINLMMMAGGNELPDVIIGKDSFNDSMVFGWGLSGSIIPVTKYYKDKKASANFHAFQEKTGLDFIPQITSPDGEIYGIPSYQRSTGNEHQPKVWYHKGWLEKLGLKEPTTTEELRTVLRAVVRGDPNGNGRADEIGIIGDFVMADVWSRNWFQFLMNSFVFAGDSNFFTVNNGRVGAAYTTPEWREGLKYMRSLFTEGLMPIENLTQNENQVKAIVNADPHRVFMVPRAVISDNFNTSNPVGDEFYFLKPLKGPNGVQYAGYRPIVPMISFLISSNCKNPDAAFRMGDTMLQPDISITSRYGEEGVNWDYPQNVKNLGDYTVRIPGFPFSVIVYDDGNIWGGTAVHNVHWRQAGPIFNAEAVVSGIGQKSGGPLRNLLDGPARVAYYDPAFQPKEIIPKLIYTEAEKNEVDIPMASLLTYLTEATSNFLAGNRDIDATWNAYLNDINNIGLPKVLATVQKVYDRMYKK